MSSDASIPSYLLKLPLSLGSGAGHSPPSVDSALDLETATWTLLAAALGALVSLLLLRLYRHGRALAAPAPSKRFGAFRELRAAGAASFALISEIDNALLSYPASDAGIGAKLERLLAGARASLDALDCLAKSRHADLRAAFESVHADVSRTLDAARWLDRAPVSFRLAELTDELAPVAGDKAVALARLLNDGFPVPDGFVLSTRSYHELSRTAELDERVSALLAALDVTDLQALNDVSNSLRQRVMAAALPPGVAKEIATQLEKMTPSADETFAVRSSMAGARQELTFAGQFDSRIHVPRERLVHAYREVCASRFNARAIAYRAHFEVAEADCPMAVLFLRTIRAESSGVLYTRDPSEPKADTLLVTASWGLGFTGACAGDRFIVSRKRRHPVISRHTRYKGVRTALARAGGIREEAVPPLLATMPSISDAKLTELAALALQVERRCGAPQDIEWAIDGDGRIWILQSRTLRLDTSTPPAHARVNTAEADDSSLLTGGITIHPGRVSGPVHVAESARVVEEVATGAIVVVRHTCPECVKFLPRIGGLIADMGNPAGHTATLVREYRLPGLFGTADASHVLAGVPVVSLDASGRRISLGSRFPGKALETGTRRSFHSSQPFALRIAPLHVSNVDGRKARLASCRSLRDVLWLAENEGVKTVLSLAKTPNQVGKESGGAVLENAEPYQLKVVDLGGGLEPAAQRSSRVALGAIRSLPFHLIWQSILRATQGRRSSRGKACGWVAVAPDYASFCLRLDGNSVLLDAFVADQQSCGSMNILLAGSGASHDSHRTAFLQQYLEAAGFHVDTGSNRVDARFVGVARHDAEERLDKIGRAVACSCEFDLLLADEESSRRGVAASAAGSHFQSKTDRAHQKT